MAKRNKGRKTPSAKAARNLEALKKAKEAVEASAKVEATKVEDPKPEERSLNKRKAVFIRLRWANQHMKLICCAQNHRI